MDIQNWIDEAVRVLKEHDQQLKNFIDDKHPKPSAKKSLIQTLSLAEMKRMVTFTLRHRVGIEYETELVEIVNYTEFGKKFCEYRAKSGEIMVYLVQLESGTFVLIYVRNNSLVYFGEVHEDLVTLVVAKTERLMCHILQPDLFNTIDSKPPNCLIMLKAAEILLSKMSLNQLEQTLVEIKAIPRNLDLTYALDIHGMAQNLIKEIGICCDELSKLSSVDITQTGVEYRLANALMLCLETLSLYDDALLVEIPNDKDEPQDVIRKRRVKAQFNNTAKFLLSDRDREIIQDIRNNKILHRFSGDRESFLIYKPSDIFEMIGVSIRDSVAIKLFLENVRNLLINLKKLLHGETFNFKIEEVIKFVGKPDNLVPLNLNDAHKKVFTFFREASKLGLHQHETTRKLEPDLQSIHVPDYLLFDYTVNIWPFIYDQLKKNDIFTTQLNELQSHRNWLTHRFYELSSAVQRNRQLYYHIMEMPSLYCKYYYSCLVWKQIKDMNSVEFYKSQNVEDKLEEAVTEFCSELSIQGSFLPSYKVDFHGHNPRFLKKTTVGKPMTEVAARITTFVNVLSILEYTFDEEDTKSGEFEQCSSGSSKRKLKGVELRQIIEAFEDFNESKKLVKPSIETLVETIANIPSKGKVSEKNIRLLAAYLVEDKIIASSTSEIVGKILPDIEKLLSVQIQKKLSNEILLQQFVAICEKQNILNKQVDVSFQDRLKPANTLTCRISTDDLITKYLDTYNEDYTEFLDDGFLKNSIFYDSTFVKFLASHSSPCITDSGHGARLLRSLCGVAKLAPYLSECLQINKNLRCLIGKDNYFIILSNLFRDPGGTNFVPIAIPLNKTDATARLDELFQLEKNNKTNDGMELLCEGIWEIMLCENLETSCIREVLGNGSWNRVLLETVAKEKMSGAASTDADENLAVRSLQEIVKYATSELYFKLPTEQSGKTADSVHSTLTKFLQNFKNRDSIKTLKFKKKVKDTEDFLIQAERLTARTKNFKTTEVEKPVKNKKQAKKPNQTLESKNQEPKSITHLKKIRDYLKQSLPNSRYYFLIQSDIAYCYHLNCDYAKSIENYEQLLVELVQGRASQAIGLNNKLKIQANQTHKKIIAQDFSFNYLFDVSKKSKSSELYKGILDLPFNLSKFLKTENILFSLGNAYLDYGDDKQLDKKQKIALYTKSWTQFGLVAGFYCEIELHLNVAVAKEQLQKIPNSIKTKMALVGDKLASLQTSDNVEENVLNGLSIYGQSFQLALHTLTGYTQTVAGFSHPLAMTARNTLLWSIVGIAKACLTLISIRVQLRKNYQVEENFLNPFVSALVYMQLENQSHYRRILNFVPSLLLRDKTDLNWRQENFGNDVVMFNLSKSIYSEVRKRINRSILADLSFIDYSIAHVNVMLGDFYSMQTENDLAEKHYSDALVCFHNGGLSEDYRSSDYDWALCLYKYGLFLKYKKNDSSLRPGAYFHEAKELLLHVEKTCTKQMEETKHNNPKIDKIQKLKKSVEKYLTPLQ